MTQAQADQLRKSVDKIHTARCAVKDAQAAVAAAEGEFNSTLGACVDDTGYVAPLPPGGPGPVSISSAGPAWLKPAQIGS
jgi:hypothetical protein